MTDSASDAGDAPDRADRPDPGDPSHEHEATLVFSFETTERAVIVAESVAQEAGEIDDERTAASVDRDGARVVVTVTAADLVALRAGGNTWCSLVSVAERAAAAPDTAAAARDPDDAPT